MARTDTDIAYAVLRKHQVYERLKNKQKILYNYIVGSLRIPIYWHLRETSEKSAFFRAHGVHFFLDFHPFSIIFG